MSDAKKQLVAGRFVEKTVAQYSADALREELPDSQVIDYPFQRAGKEDVILADILAKIEMVSPPAGLAIDIGAGCSSLTTSLHRKLVEQQRPVIAIDSREMLSRLPDQDGVIKFPGVVPDCLAELERQGEAAVVVCYGVLSPIFNHANLCDFVDGALSLLAPGGMLLLGDVPSSSMRIRELAAQGKADDTWQFGRLYPGRIDDGVIYGLLLRASNGGFHPYLLPQRPSLPISNRRVDLLFVRPGASLL